MSIASIVIPIRAASRTEDGILRLERLLQTLPDAFEVVVVDDGSHKKAAAAIYDRVSQVPHASYHYLKTRWRSFSLARARNYGTQVSTAKVVLFHDVDFFATPELYLQLAGYIKEVDLANRPEHFFCVPVAFLTEAGTLKYFSTPDDTGWFTDSQKCPDDLVMNVVEGSSCIVANRDALVAIGGHDESFYGHGAEDFELLHRLGELYPIAEKPADYAVNTGSGTITEYRGFRSYFALYGKQCRSQGTVLIHIYHPRRKGWGYYKHKRNFRKLEQLMTGSAG